MINKSENIKIIDIKTNPIETNHNFLVSSNEHKVYIWNTDTKFCSFVVEDSYGVNYEPSGTLFASLRLDTVYNVNFFSLEKDNISKNQIATLNVENNGTIINFVFTKKMVYLITLTDSGIVNTYFILQKKKVMTIKMINIVEEISLIEKESSEGNMGYGIFYIDPFSLSLTGIDPLSGDVLTVAQNNNNMSNSSKVNKMISSVDRKFCLFFNGNSIIKYS